MKVLVLAASFMVTMAFGAMAQEDRTISVIGRGSVEMVPDMAVISLGVQHQAEAAQEALALTSEAVSSILERLAAAGVEPRDIQTDTLSLQPVWARNNTSDKPPRVVGFSARNSLSIRVRDLSNLGGILDDVVGDGANTFNGLRFTVQDPAAALAEARASAVKDGMEKAAQLSEAAGVELGPVLTISEQGGVVRPQMMEMATARMASDVPVAEGEVSLSAQVSMVFSIAQ